MREHQEGVFRFAFLHLGDAQDAEDVAQETFLRAFRSLHRFDASRPLRPWLLSIAANLARNRRRALGRYWAAVRRLVSSERPEAVPGRSIDEHDPHGPQVVVAQALANAVKQLGDNDREVIILRYFMELSTAETAQALGIVEGTVKSRVHRARERLQVVIEREFPALAEDAGE